MISSFEQYFAALKGRRVAVLGLGVSNRPLVRLLLEYGAIVSGGDRTPREKLDAEVLELESMGCRLYLGEDFYKEMSGEVAFRTPGMHPRYAPGKSCGEAPARWRCQNHQRNGCLL